MLIGEKTQGLKKDKGLSEKQFASIDNNMTSMSERKAKGMLMILNGMTAICFLSQIIGWYLWHSNIAIAVCLAFQFICIIAFETAYKFLIVNTPFTSRIKIAYYRISVWMIAFAPIRLLLNAYNFVLCENRTSFFRESIAVGSYIILCTVISLKLKRK